MLCELHVADYALIERMELVLPGGLVVFTGETGAGKSIIVGALTLALGGRAQAEQLRAGSREIVIEARFLGPFDPAVEEALREEGLPSRDDLCLRRVVPEGGRSRAYVNGRTVSLATLEKVGRELVDIHGQHQHQSLLHTETHLDLLDGFGGLHDRRAALGGHYSRWEALRRERDAILSGEREKTERLEFLSFQKSEIERAGLRPGEDEELERRKEVLSSAGRLAEAAREVEDLVYSGESPAAAAVHRAAKRLGELAGVDPALGEMVALLEECQVRLEEAGREIQDYQRGLEDDPERLEETEERLAEVNRLKRKYGGSTESVLARFEEIEAEMAGLRSGEARLAEIDRELAAAEEEVAAGAGELSRLREKAAQRLQAAIEEELGRLNLPGTTFSVSLARKPEGERGLSVDGTRCGIDETGVDDARFLLSANPGEPPRPLVKVASGGELSRIMLAIKTVLADVDRVPTLIFDEVDIGIGGRTARMVGDRLKAVSRRRQVLCITHLPQIASLADSHYNISKNTRRGRAAVAVRTLDGEERVEEVARMLGGKRVTATTRKHAREMLAQRG